MQVPFLTRMLMKNCTQVTVVKNSFTVLSDFQSSGLFSRCSWRKYRRVSVKASTSLNPDQELESTPTVSIWGHMPPLGVHQQRICALRCVCDYSGTRSGVCVCGRVLPCAWRVGSCGRVCAESSGPAGSPAARRVKRPRPSSAEGKQESKSAALATGWCVSPTADHIVTTAPTTGIKTDRKRQRQTQRMIHNDVRCVFGLLKSSIQRKCKMFIRGSFLV